MNRLILRGHDIFCASGGENFGQISKISPGVRYGFAGIGSGVGPGLEIKGFQLVAARPSGERVYLLVLGRSASGDSAGTEGDVRRALCVLGADGKLRLAGVGNVKGLGYLTSSCILNGRVVVFDDVSYSVWDEACGELRESPLRSFEDAASDSDKNEILSVKSAVPVRIRLTCALGGPDSSQMVALSQDGRLLVYEQRQDVLWLVRTVRVETGDHQIVAMAASRDFVALQLQGAPHLLVFEWDADTVEICADPRKLGFGEALTVQLEGEPVDAFTQPDALSRAEDGQFLTCPLPWGSAAVSVAVRQLEIAGDRVIALTEFDELCVFKIGAQVPS